MFFVRAVKKNVLLLSFLIACILSFFIFILSFSGQSSAFAPEGQEEGVRLPILMYHSILKDPKSAGAYVISPETVEADFLYLYKNGYTPVFVSEVIDYVQNDAPLPEKPIVITLDDGYLNNLTYVFPLLEKYDFKAVISIIGLSTERFSKVPDPVPSYAHLTWDDIALMVQSGYVEIGNHTYDMHGNGRRYGCIKMRGESLSDYEWKLSEDILKTQELLYRNSGVRPVTFAYPYGVICPESKNILKKLGFKAALGCFEKVNYITKDPDGLFELKRFNRPSGIPTEKFMLRIEGEVK